MSKRVKSYALTTLFALPFLTVSAVGQAQTIEFCNTGVNCSTRVGGGGMGVNTRCSKYLGTIAPGSITMITDLMNAASVFACAFSYAYVGQPAAGALPRATRYAASGPTPYCQLQLMTAGGTYVCTLSNPDGLPVELMEFGINEEN